LNGNDEPKVVFPFFAYYIADWPEGKKVTLLRDGKLTDLPCHSCFVPNTSLNILSEETRNIKIRTNEKMKEVSKEASQMMSKRGSIMKGRDLAKKYSIHPYPV